jgi:putative membrane protein (TIGR04086 family)
MQGFAKYQRGIAMKTARVVPEVSNSFYSAAKPILIGTSFSLIISCIFLMVMAFYMSMNDMPDFASIIIAYIVTAIAALIGGIVSARIYKSRGMMVGAACGISYFLVIFIVSMFFSSHIELNTVGLLKFMLSLVFGTFGGIFGVNMKRK